MGTAVIAQVSKHITFWIMKLVMLPSEGKNYRNLISYTTKPQMYSLYLVILSTVCWSKAEYKRNISTFRVDFLSNINSDFIVYIAVL